MIISFLLLVLPRKINDCVWVRVHAGGGHRGLQLLSTGAFSVPANQPGISSAGSGDAGIGTGTARREM